MCVIREYDCNVPPPEICVDGYRGDSLLIVSVTSVCYLRV